MRTILTLLVSGLLLTVTVGMIPVAGCVGGEEEAESVDDAGNGAIQLLKRVFTNFPFGGEPEVLIGELPSGLTVPVPIPPDAEVLGSLDYSDEYRQAYALIDVPGTPEDVIAFYSEQFNEAGWHEVGSTYSEGGFQPTLPAWALFCCQEKGGPSAQIVVDALPSQEATFVRLVVDTDPQSDICLEEGPLGRNETGRLVPIFEDPEGGHNGKKGYGLRSGSELFSYMFVDTELDPGQLQAHYGRQLEEAGWTSEIRFTESALAWSTWYHIADTGGEWLGLFVIHDVADGRSKCSFFASRVDERE